MLALRQAVGRAGPGQPVPDMLCTHNSEAAARLQYCGAPACTDGSRQPPQDPYCQDQPPSLLSYDTQKGWDLTASYPKWCRGSGSLPSPGQEVQETESFGTTQAGHVTTIPTLCLALR